MSRKGAKAQRIREMNNEIYCDAHSLKMNVFLFLFRFSPLRLCDKVLT
jgi:hypothetical protein